MHRVLFILFLLPAAASAQFSEAIEDNSFYIEEAYNQEEGVVQHIFTGAIDPTSSDLIGTFTQEWPVMSQEHQWSYTLPLLATSFGGTGLGDVMINYRYQFWKDGNWAWMSPRFSLILPTGSTASSRGLGVTGYQVNLPLSKRLSDGFILHVNAGATLYPHAEQSVAGGMVKRSVDSYFLGASGILLLQKEMNILVEVLTTATAQFDGSGKRSYGTSTIVSPGARWAIDVGTLQIVPGIAAPVQFSGGAATVQIFGYLSFEHPF